MSRSANPSRTVILIPARMASTRLPGKPLIDIAGAPMIVQVLRRAREAEIGEPVVATDSEAVAAAVEKAGGRAVMTRADHASGSDRIFEALQALDPERRIAFVVNVQGDEPEIDPGVIDAAVEALVRTGAPVATVGSPFAPGEDPRNPNVVKVVCALDGTAMYFSRSPIPFDRDGRGGPDAAPLRHVGLYVYRRSFLDVYVGLEPTPAERCESLEQLRVLQHGYKIAVAVRECSHQGVDTPEQYEAFVGRWRAAGS